MGHSAWLDKDFELKILLFLSIHWNSKVHNEIIVNESEPESLSLSFYLMDVVI